MGRRKIRVKPSKELVGKTNCAGEIRKIIHAIPPGLKSRAAEPGTAAYEYISGQRLLNTVDEDERFIGALREPDGALLVFTDGSSVLYQEPTKVN